MHDTVYYYDFFIDARVLQKVNYCYLSYHVDLSFLSHLMCASYESEVYMCFELQHAIFTEVLVLYFCDICGD